MSRCCAAGVAALLAASIAARGMQEAFFLPSPSAPAAGMRRPAWRGLQPSGAGGPRVRPSQPHGGSHGRHVVASAAGPVFTLLGKSAFDLFPVSNLSLVSWITMILFPRWSKTPQLALVAPVLLSMLYGVAIVHVLRYPPPGASAADFSSLAGLVNAFSNPDGVFAGWLHYCVTDPLVGLAISLDAKRLKVGRVFLVPCLLLTLLFGPLGFLSWMVVRTAAERLDFKRKDSKQ